MPPLANHPGFRIFVLGAGFSRPAGLPLATELYSAVRTSILAQHGSETKFSRDVSRYLRYCSDCGVTGQTEENLDLELFMSYLDIEHYLGLRGSDTWSLEGNESQLMIRKAIGQIIHSRTPSADRLPDFYYRFAECLSPHDTVLSLNYDLVLERALSVEYIRIVLYKMPSNHGSWWNERMLGTTLKDYARFVDFRASGEQIADYQSRYRFADPERSRFHYSGFGHEAIDFLFGQRREASYPSSGTR